MNRHRKCGWRQFLASGCKQAFGSSGLPDKFPFRKWGRGAAIPRHLPIFGTALHVHYPAVGCRKICIGSRSVGVSAQTFHFTEIRGGHIHFQSSTVSAFYHDGKPAWTGNVHGGSLVLLAAPGDVLLTVPHFHATKRLGGVFCQINRHPVHTKFTVVIYVDLHVDVAKPNSCANNAGRHTRDACAVLFDAFLHFKPVVIGPSNHENALFLQMINVAIVAGKMWVAGSDAISLACIDRFRFGQEFFCRKCTQFRNALVFHDHHIL